MVIAEPLPAGALADPDDPTDPALLAALDMALVAPPAEFIAEVIAEVIAEAGADELTAGELAAELLELLEELELLDELLAPVLDEQAAASRLRPSTMAVPARAVVERFIAFPFGSS